MPRSCPLPHSAPLSSHRVALTAQEGRDAMKSFAEFQRITRELLDEMRAVGREALFCCVFSYL